MKQFFLPAKESVISYYLCKYYEIELPMCTVFFYNPLIFNFESNTKGGLKKDLNTI